MNLTDAVDQQRKCNAFLSVGGRDLYDCSGGSETDAVENLYEPLKGMTAVSRAQLAVNHS
jgi:hypothetical protein